MNLPRNFILVATLLGFAPVWAADAPAAATSAAGSPTATAPATEEKIALEAPRSVAVDKDGNLFIADFSASTIYKLTPAGNLTRIAGSPSATSGSDGPALKAGFMNPCGIAVDQKGNVYIADTDNSLVRKISTDGNVTTIGRAPASAAAGSSSTPPPPFSNPTSVVVDKDGNVFVASSGDAAVFKISADGAVTTFAGKIGAPGSNDGPGADARFAGPRGIAIDTAGNLYVADEGNSNIRKITPAGNVTTLAGKPGSVGDKDGPGAEATFGSPRGLAVDKDGNVFVADTDNSVVRKITPAGIVTTFAGKSGLNGAADGKVEDARFNGLRGIAVDTAGNIYVADSDNAAIRKITPAGMVITIAGVMPSP